MTFPRTLKREHNHFWRRRRKKSGLKLFPLRYKWLCTHSELYGRTACGARVWMGWTGGGAFYVDRTFSIHKRLYALIFHSGHVPRMNIILCLLRRISFSYIRIVEEMKVNIWGNSERAGALWGESQYFC